jgi:hypothetical protein
MHVPTSMRAPVRRSNNKGSPARLQRAAALKALARRVKATSSAPNRYIGQAIKRLSFFWPALLRPPAPTRLRRQQGPSQRPAPTASA